MDAAFERMADSQRQDKASKSRRPPDDAPIEDRIRYEIYEAAKLTGDTPIQCEVKIQAILEKVKAQDNGGTRVSD